jgi:sulfofructose kinase
LKKGVADKMADVLCIGAVAYDINVPLEYFPEENTKVHIENMLEEGGGPAANAAYLLSKWGVDSAFAGIIGDDVYGRHIEQEFKEINTDISMLQKHESLGTPLSIVMVNKKNGSRTIISRRSKNMNLQVDIRRLKKLNPIVMLFDGHELEASLTAMEAFPSAKTILDAGSLREGTEVLGGKVDYLVCSERFALSYTGLPDLISKENQKKCINTLKVLNKKQVVVTIGEKGLIYEKDGKLIHMKAFKADAVDTTGAGDIFHGAFAYGVLKNMPLFDILQLSSMAACISVGSQGGRKSIPSLRQVENGLIKAASTEKPCLF